MSQHVSVLHFFLWLNIPLCGVSLSILFIHSSGIDTWDVPTFWLFRIMLLFVNRLCLNNCFQFSWVIYIGVELLGCTVILCLIF